MDYFPIRHSNILVLRLLVLRLISFTAFSFTAFSFTAAEYRFLCARLKVIFCWVYQSLPLNIVVYSVPDNQKKQ